MTRLKNLARLIKETVEVRPPDQEFLSMLNDTISRANPTRKPSKTFKPSSLGGCLRRVYFEVTGAPIDEGYADPELVGMGESGTARHEHIQGYITRMKSFGHDCEWIDVEEYLKIRPQPGTEVVEKKGMETKLRNTVLNLSFMCDGIIKLKGVYYVLEIKTEISFKWQSRTDVVDKHLTQAATYGSCLGIRKVMYLYENRDMCKKKSFAVEITEADIMDRVVGRVETVNGHIEDKTVPPMTTTKSECNYCPFGGECRKWT